MPSQQFGLLSSVADAIAEVCFVKDCGGRYAYCNEAFSRFVGVSRARIIGSTDEILFGSSFATALSQDERQVLDTGVSSVTGRVFPSQGGYQNIPLRLSAYRDDAGEIQGVVAVGCGAPDSDPLTVPSVVEVDDVAFRPADPDRYSPELFVLNEVGIICSGGTSADEILSQITRLIAKSLYQGNCGFFLLDEHRKVFVQHRSMVFPEPGIEYLEFDDDKGLVGKTARCGRAVRVANVLEDEDYYCIDARTRSEMCVPLHCDGSIIGVMNIESPAFDAFSEADERLIVTVLDLISTSLERLKAQKALSESEGRIGDLVDAIPQIVWMAGPDGGLFHLNAKASEYTGVKMDQLTGWSWDAVIHPDDLAGTIEDWTACLCDGVSRDMSFRIKRHDGVYRWHITRQVPVRDVSGQIVTWYGTCTDVEDLMVAEQSLRESEERFRLLFEGAADAIFWADAETGRLTHCNRAAEVLLGRDRREIVGQLQTFIHPPEEADHYQEIFRQHIAEATRTPVEIEVQRKDGVRVPVSVSPSLTTVSGHTVIQGIFRDISARRKIQRTLQMMQFCVDHAGDSVFWLNRAGQVLYVNEAACISRGYLREELLRMTVFDLDMDRGGEFAQWAIHFEDIKNRGSVTLETRHRAKDGRVFPVEVNANYVDVDGQEMNFAFVRDISERKQREERISQLAAIVESSADAIFGMTLDGEISSWNRGASNVFGFDEAAVVGQPLSAILPQNAWLDLQRVLERISEGGGIEQISAVACRCDEQSIEVALTVSPVWAADGLLLGASAIARNVTEVNRAEAERQRAERDLRVSEERFSKLFYASPFSIIVATYPEGKIIEVNDAFLRLFSFDREAVLGKTTGELNIWVDPSARMEMVERLKRDESARDMQLEFRSNTGHLLTLLMSVEIIWLQGQPHSLAMSIDITDRRKLEEQLRQSQKMEAVGQLAGGVAHDFNNLLTVINGYSDLLPEMYAEKESWHASVREIGEAGRRAAELTEQLLAFSRRSFTQPRVLQLNEVVVRAEKLLRRLIGEQIDLRVDMEPELHPIKADLNQIEQVLMNLAVNARDAMPAGGQLVIRTQSILVADATVSVMLQVIDTGLGMNDDVLSRAFEPFFTTKEIGRGSGLGLAVVHGIVKQNGGEISVSSAPGKGACFSICFPAVEAIVNLNSEPLLQPSLSAGCETILLVEDEPGVRRLIRMTLERQGYRIVEATNGDEAMAIASRMAGPIHLLLTDVVMPGMDGRSLADLLRNELPDLRVIYISGYNEVERLRNPSSNPRDTFLRKPLLPQELVQRVREHLDGEFQE
ncbi:MAG: PAS domain S-box protein [Planctomycetaceae bacterium]|nr:PAS domain S-box protein [Planctomycetaceae bacterium]